MYTENEIVDKEVDIYLEDLPYMQCIYILMYSWNNIVRNDGLGNLGMQADID